MRYANMKHALLKTAVILVCAGLVLPVATGLAQENNMKLPDFYPENFSGHGCIDSMTYDRVVIDDRLMKFSAGATFHTPRIKVAAWSSFSEGDMAGFIVNDDNEIESFWYIQSCR